MKGKRGHICECCGQFVKEYYRPLNASMVRGLILYRNRFRVDGFADWIHMERWFKSIDGLSDGVRGDFPKMRFWGLIEKCIGYRPDGSNRVGLYRITPKGVNFVDGEIKVRHRVHLYNNVFQGYLGGNVSILDCLGEKFNYRDLMGGI